MAVQVDGKDNEKVQSLYLEDLPIHQAAFACDGQQVCRTRLPACQALSHDCILMIFQVIPLQGGCSAMHAALWPSCAAASRFPLLLEKLYSCYCIA